VGKSRLVHELAQQARAEGWIVLETSGTALTQPLAWRPIRRLLESWLEVESRRTPNGERAAWPSSLRHWGPARELRSAPGDARPAGLRFRVEDLIHPARRAVGAAVREVVGRVAELAPLVLVFEDLHWMDERRAPCSKPGGRADERAALHRRDHTATRRRTSSARTRRSRSTVWTTAARRRSRAPRWRPPL
jgi:hypothetical protein